ncbi:hypothetical protein HYH03_000113 [Edaphochlamys debaryana]|uniref:Calponin-homology (CH) domain-containing protein n=1 Tax=Edaphochlamys debaryana TaxID=47281 RepID=A0A835YI29_9CHLO|nr:hypothetical protein HYH03_000113 [Edaphochlamys debaryana]|eukprot:KAG2501608.1 hypothetical protein HYH03_000113 [Edaphochlamys debaryana]
MTSLLDYFFAPSGARRKKPGKHVEVELHSEPKEHEGTELAEIVRPVVRPPTSELSAAAEAVAEAVPEEREQAGQGPSEQEEGSLGTGRHADDLVGTDHAADSPAAALTVEQQFVLLTLSRGELSELSALCRSGILLCKLLSSALPGSLDERAVNGEAGEADDVEAFENVQLAASAALAHGCDVQSIQLERLVQCEAEAVTDFVLEVIRTSAQQALPPADRHWFTAHAPASGATQPHGSTGQGRPGPGPSGSSAADAGPSTPRAAGGSAVPSAAPSPARGSAQTAAALAIAPAAHSTVAAGSQGSAAARRAAAGLERWALEGLGQQAQEATAEGAAQAVLSSEGRGAGQAGTQPAAGTPDPSSDALTLAAWERLAAVLAHAAQTPVPTPGTSPDGVAEDTAEATPAAEAPGGSEDESRWEAVAASLSASLSAGAAAAGDAWPLPPLRPAYLRCRHPGLRSALLARALLLATRPPGGRSRGPSSGGNSGRASVEVGLEAVRCGEAGSRSLDGELSPGGSTAAGSSPRDRLSGDGGGDATVEGGHTADASAIASALSAEAPVPAEADSTEATASTSPAPELPAVAPPSKPGPPPASPAPPAPPPRAGGWGGSGLRPTRSALLAQAQAPVDMLSEHNQLVMREHQQRELRRQQRSMGGGGGAGGARRGAGQAGAGGGGAVGVRGRVGELWGGEAEDLTGDNQEERVLRLWLNSLDPRIGVTSLFAAEVATGWPLLLALDAIEPGCVSWHDTFRPPFKEKLRKILSVQNCNQVIGLCTGRLALPLVNIGGLDLALGERRATLSLVFQLMRHHTGLVLGLVAPQAQPGPAAAHPPAGPLSPSGSFRHGHGAQAHAGPHGPSQHVHHRPAAVEVEKAVLAWANAKLAEAARQEAAAAAAATSTGADAIPAEGAGAGTGAGVGAAAGAGAFVPLSSFSDARLGEGRILLQLLAAISPRAVAARHVLSGRTPEERESNAKYLLSCARKLGCVIFLVWEDVVAARPNLLLLLLASFMAMDRKLAGRAGERA